MERIFYPNAEWYPRRVEVEVPRSDVVWEPRYGEVVEDPLAYYIPYGLSKTWGIRLKVRRMAEDRANLKHSHGEVWDIFSMECLRSTHSIA